MRDCRLEGIEAIIQRQQRVLTKGNDDCLFLERQHRGSRFPRAGRQIGNRRPLLPFGDGLLVDPVALGQRPQALLTILYCSTDRLCRCGAAVKNLSHSASFHFWENNAPSKPGIKHLRPGTACLLPRHIARHPDHDGRNIAVACSGHHSGDDCRRRGACTAPRAAAGRQPCAFPHTRGPRETSPHALMINESIGQRCKQRQKP